MPRLLRPIVVCVAASALALASASASAQAAGWLPPQEALNASGGAESAPHVAVDAAGNVYATWLEGGQLEAAKRPLGGGWETPQAVSLGTAVKPATPDIGADSSGNAVLVWRAATSTGTPIIQEATRPAAAAAFGAPTTLSNASDSLVSGPRVEVNGSGRAVLAYRDTFNATGEVTAGIGSAAAGFDPTALRVFSETTTSVGNPEDAIDASGDAAVVWTVSPPAGSPGAPAVHAGYAPAGGRFPAGGTETAGSSSASTPPFDAHVALDSGGRAVATWAEGSPNNGKILASARTAGAGGSWNEFKTALDGPFSGAGNEPDVAFDATGAAVAAWGGDGFLRSSLLPPGATQFAQPPQTLASSEGPADIDLDSNAGGFEVLVWSSQDGAGSARAAVRPSGGLFGPIATLSPAGQAVQGTHVAVDPTGNAAAVWVQADTKIETAEYDATAPHFTSGPQVPATPHQGQPAAFSAAAADDWSLPTIAWDFGDGTSGTGGSVSHTYAAAGTYHVVATATDGAGNAAVPFSQDITVTAPPVPPPKEGKSFNASLVSGTVFVSVPKGKATGGLLKRPVVHGAAGPVISAPHGYTGFRHLGKNDNVPVGSILDATRGVSSIKMAANHAGTKFQKGSFSLGAFLVKQTTHSPLTSAEMMGGGNFKNACTKARRKVSAARSHPHRRLFASVKGHFRTRGRHSTATVRGTKYLVKDTCAGTLTRVTQGRVVVRDFRRHKTVIVKTGHQYLARA